jgi:hypothetical protein
MQQPMTTPSVVSSDVSGSLFAQILEQLPYDPYRGASEESAEELLLLVGANQENIEPEFNRLVGEWKASRHATSFSRDLVTPAYLRIIGLGPKVLPLILRELGKELDHWFLALKSVSGEDPVPPQSRGKIQEMANAWLKWGREKGHVR